MLEKLLKAKDVYTKILVSICAVICTTILIMFIIQCFMRYVFDVAFVYTEDVAVIGLLWNMALGISLGTLHHEHLLINVIDSIVSKKTLNKILFVEDFIIFFFGILMIIFGNKSLQMNRGFTQSMIGFDESFRYIPVLVGGALTSLAAAECILEQILVWKKEKEGK